MWKRTICGFREGRRVFGGSIMWIASYTCCLFSGWALTFIAAPARRPPSLTHISSSPWDQKKPIQSHNRWVSRRNGAIRLLLRSKLIARDVLYTRRWTPPLNAVCLIQPTNDIPSTTFRFNGSNKHGGTAWGGSQELAFKWGIPPFSVLFSPSIPICPLILFPSILGYFLPYPILYSSFSLPSLIPPSFAVGSPWRSRNRSR